MGYDGGNMNFTRQNPAKPFLLFALLAIIVFLAGCNRKVVQEEPVQGGHIVLAADPSTPQNSGEQALETAVSETVKEQVGKINAKNVELVFCLDTSSSMDGLIESVKQRLWDIAKDIKNMPQAPTLRIALLAYGTPGFGNASGYVKLINDLTEDTDAIHNELTALKCNGGDEYVPKVVVYAIDNLSWGNKPDTLRTIFVAGNESADQGPVKIDEMLDRAKNTNTLVNTIFCGAETHFYAKGWKDIAEKSGGKFSAVEFKMNLPQIKLPQIKLPININIPGITQPTAAPVIPTQATQPASFPTSPGAFPTVTAPATPVTTPTVQGQLQPFASPSSTTAALPPSAAPTSSIRSPGVPARPASRPPSPASTKASPSRTAASQQPPGLVKVEGTITGIMGENLLVRETYSGRNRTFRADSSTSRTPSSWNPASNDMVVIYYKAQDPVRAAKIEFMR